MSTAQSQKVVGPDDSPPFLVRFIYILGGGRADFFDDVVVPFRPVVGDHIWVNNESDDNSERPNHLIDAEGEKSYEVVKVEYFLRFGEGAAPDLHVHVQPAEGKNNGNT